MLYKLLLQVRSNKIPAFFSRPFRAATKSTFTLLINELKPKITLGIMEDYQAAEKAGFFSYENELLRRSKSSGTIGNMLWGVSTLRCFIGKRDC